jgi:hypothetical protein
MFFKERESMKKLALAVLATTMTGVAFAATTGTLVLSGTVPALLSITVTPEAIAAALPLDTTQTNTLVAVVNEKSNSNTGYKVNISSDNEGLLIHDSVLSSTIAYTLKYNGSTVDLAGDEFVYASAAAVDADRNIQISYTGVPHTSLIEGDYSDSVTFTISAN